MTLILVDQDGVIANWGKGWDEALDLLGAPSEIARHNDQRSFDLKDGHTHRNRQIIDSVMEMPGFYADLEPIPGAIEALKEMVAEGHEVAIVTSPYWSNTTCINDKVEWVRRNLGQSWLSRMILTSDKTRVDGQILIDDKPRITGARVPNWEHVYFDQPYNQLGSNLEVSPRRRRLTDWANWRDLLPQPASPAPAVERPAGRLVGMGGLLASGKDTVADHLVDKYDFVKVNMSAVLHEAMLALDPIVQANDEGVLSYSAVVERQGYTKAKTIPEVRRLLQALGTDVGRNIIGENVWVDIVGRQIGQLLSAGTNVVISGIRFPNELKMVRDLGGSLWWTDRGHASLGSSHASENSVQPGDFDRVIDNFGTLDQLSGQVDYLAASVFSLFRVDGHTVGDTPLESPEPIAIRGHEIRRPAGTINAAGFSTVAGILGDFAAGDITERRRDTEINRIAKAGIAAKSQVAA